MPDPKQTVENIRSFLAADQTHTPELSQWATDYAELCKEANARLRRCADFLRQGLRAEAIQYADCAPSLIDLASSLDFAELGAWETTCATYGVSRPVRVKLDSAKSLNEAYAEQVPIEPLLVKHRLLALTNAPLADRLSVLRKLAELDPVSACWGEDVGQFEQARFSILKSETAAAIKAGDLSWIDRLLNEVMAEPWRTPVPEALKQALATASTALHQTEAIGQLRGLVPRIQEALSAMNPEECKRVAAEWGRIVTTAKVPVPADLLAEYLPLSQWLEQLAAGRQQDRSFRAACDELAAGIDLNAASEDLRQRYRRAAAFQMGLPEELEREYQRKLTALEREQKQEKFRQHMVAMVLVIAVAAAIGALVYVLLFYGKH